MFNRKKFKEGDKVMPLNDMTQSLYVQKSWLETSDFIGSIIKTEKVACCDGKVYYSDELTHYSEPLKILAKNQKAWEERLEALEPDQKESEHTKDTLINKLISELLDEEGAKPKKKKSKNKL